MMSLTFSMDKITYYTIQMALLDTIHASSPMEEYDQFSSLMLAFDSYPALDSFNIVFS